MGKRTVKKHVRRKEDAYDTPDRAIMPLLPHLPPKTHFLEPMAGAGQLIDYLQTHGHICVGAYDIKPRKHSDSINVHNYVNDPDHGFYLNGIQKADARKMIIRKLPYIPKMMITNPAWTRSILHEIILNFDWQCPTWLLLDSDWKHTQHAKPYLPLIQKEVSVGRVKWIPDSKDYSKDNCSWYLFHGESSHQFIGRHF